MRSSVIVAVLTLLALAAHTLRAQDEPAPQAQGEFELAIDDLGVGALIRRGDWTGIRVRVTDRGTRQRDIILRLTIRDADGDDAQFDRVVSANPGLPQTFWLYGWIPFRDSGAPIQVQAFEALEPSSGGEGQLAYRPGRLLAVASAYNARLQEPDVGLIAVVGTRQLGLDGYAHAVDALPWRPMGHELQRIASGLDADALPDRWQGLLPFDTIVWSTTGLREHDPSSLSPERARALITWIQRGGHLVIVLPPQDDPWFGGPHPLLSILPKINRPTRAEGVDYDALHPLLSETRDIPLPDNAALSTFTPQQTAAPTEAIPILDTIDDETVVVRRLIGSGAVTLVGIDLSNNELRRLGLPDVEPFWHRVLGMRGAAPRADELDDQTRNIVKQRETILFDTTLNAEIAKTGRAVQGILFGLLVFALYFLIAGPIGYWILKARNQTQHAWLGFVALIALFTIFSWMGASLMRPKRVSITHLTLYEHVHGQDTARARSWMSVMLPSYGQSTVAVENPDNPNDDNLLAPWEPSAAVATLASGFPDNTGYRIESRRPDSIRVPTRATVKQFRADWAGPPPWEGIKPVAPIGQPNTPPITLDGTIVRGSIEHGLPAPLTNVLVLVVSRQNPIREPGVPLDNALIARVNIWSPSLPNQEWAPGDALDLAPITTASMQNLGDARDYLTRAVGFGINTAALASTPASIENRLIAARLLSQLEPPNYSIQNLGTGSKLATRRELHGWDLGRWFTQPCVIILGTLDIPQRDESESAIPVPITVDERPARAAGKTLISWIYPLDPAPPVYPFITANPQPGPASNEQPAQQPSESDQP